MPKERPKLQDPRVTRDEARREADRASAALLNGIAEDLMNGYNRLILHRRNYLEEMARLGHDTPEGFEFVIERRGRTATVTVRWGLDG